MLYLISGDVGRAMVFSYAAAFLLQVLVLVLTFLVDGGDATASLEDSKAFLYFFNIVVTLTANAVPFFLLAKAWRIPIYSFITHADINTFELFMYTFVCIGVNVAGLSAVRLIESFLTRFGIEFPAPVFDVPSGDTAGAILLIIFACVIAPLIEEFIFRGVLLRLFSRFGALFSVIFTSMLFGIFHGNLYQALPAFLIGTVLATATLKTGSVWPAMAIHSFNNSLALILQNRAVSADSLDTPLTLAFMSFLGICMIGAVLAPILRRDLFRLPKLSQPPKRRLRTLLSNPSMLCALIIYIGSMIVYAFIG